MKILVTGGAGYIGSHTCKELAILGHTPVVYDNLSTGYREFVKWGEFIYGDILDTQKLRSCLSRIRPDGIIHFAAFSCVGESVTDPGKYYRNNVCGTLSLLEAMQGEGVDNIVVSSTCAVYGEPAAVPITEDCQAMPVNPYGMSKMVMERMLRDYSAAYGLHWVALRYFNAAGCDADGEIGEKHEPETHLIPRVIAAYLGWLEHVDIFGNDYNTPDGSCIRDYIHVKDLAIAHILAMDYLMANNKCCAFNLGSERGFSVFEVINGLEKITGGKVPIKIKPRRAGDAAILIADATNAHKFLNWTCKYSNLTDILDSALCWSRNCGA